jgi:hypothetical protein
VLLRPGKGDVQHEACFRDSGAAAAAACGCVTSRSSKLLQQWHSDLLSCRRLCTGTAGRCGSLGVDHSSIYVLVRSAARILRSYSSSKACERCRPPANPRDTHACGPRCILADDLPALSPGSSTGETQFDYAKQASLAAAAAAAASSMIITSCSRPETDCYVLQLADQDTPYS